MYVLSTGCQWRALPKDLPPKSTVFCRFVLLMGSRHQAAWAAHDRKRPVDEKDNKVLPAHGTWRGHGGYVAMPDFPIDPELRIRATTPVVLRRTTEAVKFIRKMALSGPDRAWHDVLETLEAAGDEWSAMEAVVHLELLLETTGLLIEEGTALASRSEQGHFRAA